MRLKKLLHWIHLWIGLITGILFFVIALSGAIYSWAPEISQLIYKQKVKAQDLPFVPVSKLKQVIDREFPTGDFITACYRGKNRTAEVLLYAPGTYYYAFINPYTGQVQHIQDMKKGWLNYTKFLHRNLILGPPGRKVVHWVTLLFAIMIVTGLVLWWPSNKAGVKQRLVIKWRVSPFKLNYDLHNILGFYASWVLIFVVGTGLFWGFKGFRNGLQVVFGEKKITYDKAKSIVPGSKETFDQFVLLDKIAAEFLQRFPDKFINISNPHEADQAVEVVVLDPNQRGYLADHFFFDRYSGKAITGRFEHGRYKEKSAYQQLNNLVYDIHFGTVWGLPGRLLVFFASLIAASLPVTGFLVWWGKGRKIK